MIAGSEEQMGSKHRLSDVVGVDISSTGVKLVRMRRSKEGFLVAHARLQDPVDVVTCGKEGKRARIVYAKDFRAKAAAVAYTGENAIVQLIHLPGFSRNSKQAGQVVRDHVGLKLNYRLGYSVSSQIRGQSDTSLVVVGLPEEETTGVLEISEGGPLPVSIEVSSLSTLTAFTRDPIVQSGEELIGIVESGARVTCLAIFHQGVPVLIRKFEFGGDQVVECLMRQFDLDMDTARQIMSDQNFDLSGALLKPMESFLRQLSISKDFIERNTGTKIDRWFVTGGMSLLKYWCGLVSKTVGMEAKVWNPVENLCLVPDGWPDNLQGQEVRFAGAIGAAIGALEEE